MDKKLVIIGTGLFPSVAKDYFNQMSKYQVVAFACHKEFKRENEIYDLPLVTVEELTKTHPPEKFEVFVGIGYKNMNKIRQATYEELKDRGYRFAVFVHPDIRIYDSTTLGDNVFIFEDNTIQPFTTIGYNTILWSGNHVGHHSVIGNHCFISSHVVISGSCKVGNNVFIGVNATLHDSITISDECLIGAGAIISKDTKPKEAFVPESTKPFHKNSEEIGF